MNEGRFRDFLKISSVEIVDVSGEGKICPTLPDYPLELTLFTAAFYDGKIVACGGLLNSPTVDWIPTDRCFSLGPDLSKWEEMYSLPYGPTHAFASSVIDNKWLLTGGESAALNTFTDTSMVLDGSFFSPAPELPKPKDFHCQLTINSTHVFFTSGLKDTFLLDWDTQKYTILDDIPARMTFAACGLFKNDNFDLEVIVADGKSGHIFSFANLEWRDGPKLPQNILYSSSAQTKNGILSLGGWIETSGTVNSIYRFDASSHDWILEDIELNIKRDQAAAVSVPDDFLNCQ